MEREKKIWPNYYQLALMLGCDSLEGTQLVKESILKYLNENPDCKSEEYFKHTVSAVYEIETRFKNGMEFDVNVDNIDTRHLNNRDMDAIVKFGINPYFLLECLWNPNFYNFDEPNSRRDELLGIV